ncbi:MAG TPA: hypothetical protein VFV76_01340 [Actinomycetes bacterium]|nr:hypothetical protein [Actinomycetes bacterium]
MVVQHDGASGPAAPKTSLDVLGRMPAWLAALGDGERLRRSLSSALRAAGDGQLKLLSCEPGRLRFEAGHWSGTYRAVVHDAGVDEPRTVLLRGTDQREPGPARPPRPGDRHLFGGRAWTTYLPDLGLDLRTEPPEPDLPAMALLADPDSARSLLEDGIQRSGPAWTGFRIRSCEPRVLRYKPGRGTVWYTLTYDDDVPRGRWPDAVVVKVYQGAKGRVSWDALRALWGSPMAQSAVAIAEPIAFLADHNALVQRAVAEEETLKQAIRRAVTDGSSIVRAELLATVRRAAAGLADLHGCGVATGTTRGLADEVDELRGVAAGLAVRVPDLDAGVEHLLGMISASAAVNPADPPRPAHGSFRPAQALLSRQGLAFIDFDSYCQAEPALDLALFRTSVRRLASGTRDRAALVDVSDEFLAAYRERGSVSLARLALWEALALLTDALHCWTKVRPAELPGAVAALAAHLGTAMPPAPRRPAEP